jgi:hypothetical protein
MPTVLDREEIRLLLLGMDGDNGWAAIYILRGYIPDLWIFEQASEQVVPMELRGYAHPLYSKITGRNSRLQII